MLVMDKEIDLFFCKEITIKYKWTAFKLKTNYLMDEATNSRGQTSTAT